MIFIHAKTVKIFILSMIIVLISSCKQQEPEDVIRQIDSSKMLDSLITTYGGDQFFNSTLTYDVNGLSYDIERQNNILNAKMTRESKGVTYTATYSNGHIEYFIDSEKQEQGSYKRFFFDTKLDAFVYLTSIPHVLERNDVILEFLPETTSSLGQNFFIAHVTYKDDSKNELYLYIDKTTNRIAYQVEKFGLMQSTPIFKEFYNYRYINGILIADYDTYFSSTDDLPLKDYLEQFISGDLKKREEYKFQNVEVIITANKN